jgi:hypothetical protein
MVYAVYSGKRQTGSIGTYIHPGIIEKDIAATNTGTIGNAHAGIGFEGLIYHEVDIEVTAETIAGSNTIGTIGPAVSSVLDHEMIGCTVGDINFAPVFFNFFLGLRQCQRCDGNAQ